MPHDVKHSNSSLCACADCNKKWLAARNAPTKKRRIDYEAAAALNPTRHKHYQVLFANFGLQLALHAHVLARLSYWRVFDARSSWHMETGFDVDLDRILRQLETKTPLGQITLVFQSASTQVRTTSTATGGPCCVVCDTPGGLPCPAMVRQALSLGIKLAYPPNDARLVPNHVHPGRCRKRLRQLLDSTANKT